MIYNCRSASVANIICPFCVSLSQGFALKALSYLTSGRAEISSLNLSVHWRANRLKGDTARAQ
jgi:hypothetical protein